MRQLEILKTMILLRLVSTIVIIVHYFPTIISQFYLIILLGKENQEPSSHSICLNEGSDYSADSGDEYHPPRGDRSSSTSSSIVSSNIKRGKKRVRCSNKWKQNVRKTLKNLGYRLYYSQILQRLNTIQ